MSLAHSNTSLLPRVLGRRALDADSLAVQLFIPDDLACLAGHFPSVALVPGVAQLDWVVRFADLTVADLAKLIIKKLKFQRPLMPGHTVSLSINFDRHKNALRFSFQGDEVEYSSGEIHF